LVLLLSGWGSAFNAHQSLCSNMELKKKVLSNIHSIN
jgi:hypothetical protein